MVMPLALVLTRICCLERPRLTRLMRLWLQSLTGLQWHRQMTWMKLLAQAKKAWLKPDEV
jgi:hypothetical protein